MNNTSIYLKINIVRDYENEIFQSYFTKTIRSKFSIFMK